MSQPARNNGIIAGRLNSEQYSKNFDDLHPALEPHEALVAADRCYFCYDAPCVTACPTEIDIPLFIRQISTGTPEAAAKTILSQNILGGMCARVCPTETLCEEACVREKAEGKPVEIGRLQRFATDKLMKEDIHPFERLAETGKKIAIVGAGPAGLACAHRLAMYGHNVSVFDNRQKAGGLNEFGIAAYKATNDFAAEEVKWLMKIGGIKLELGKELGKDVSLDVLKSSFDAVFIACGLPDVNVLGVSGEEKENVEDAISFISRLRQVEDLSELPVGRHVVVIGGGMTAVDAAVQSKLLGAEQVHLVYRRGKESMKASKYEQNVAASRGVNIMTNAQPIAILGDKAVEEVEFIYTENDNGNIIESNENFRLKADQVFKAIGQKNEIITGSLTLKSGKVVIDNNGKTSIPGVWAGGDCVGSGEDLTVTAVAQGRDAAEDIHKEIKNQEIE